MSSTTRTGAVATTDRDRSRDDIVLRRAERFAAFLDTRIRIPGTTIRFGYDPIIGLLPVVGDSIGVMLGLYPIIEAVRLRLGAGTMLRMLLNLTIDWLVGLLPFVDIVLDAAYKANVRNARVLALALERRSPSDGDDGDRVCRRGPPRGDCTS